jgi:ATP-dependent helicase HrpB
LHTEALPIVAALPDLKAALQTHSAAVLQAPPGAGKSTFVPLALLNEPWLQHRKILMLEPRRIATRAVASRMASNRRESLGQTVGYRTRLDTKVGARTRIEVVTEGILTRMLQADAALEDVGLVIFDEYHERNLQADLGLALCLDVQATLREDLKLLAMSATLDGSALASLLNEAPIVSSMGHAFPVTTHYRQRVASRTQSANPDVCEELASVIGRALESDAGDMLVFLPGQGEIRRLQRLLENARVGSACDVYALYGDLSAADQDRAIAPGVPGRRKIVLATNIAETSLTIEGVRIVVDSGLERRSRFDPATGMNKLDTVRISRASADQRRGRAGRTAPGVCYRWWTESEHAALRAHTPAEILETDLAPLALELASWGVTEPSNLRWLDAPPSAPFAQARDLLTALAAIGKDGKITSHGREMAALGVHPRLAHMLVQARTLGLARLGSEIAAALGERDLIRNSGPARSADFRLRIEALRDPSSEVDRGARQRTLQTAQQLQSRLGAVDAQPSDPHLHVGRLLAFAYPDRIACARSERGRYLLSGGRGALLADPHLFGAEFLSVAQLDAGEREARIQLAAPISRAHLEQDHAQLIREEERVAWDTREQAIVALRERWLGAIKLEERRLEQPDTEQVMRAMLTGIAEMGLVALPWTREARMLQQRIEFARAHDMQDSWPDVSDEKLGLTLNEWLAPWLVGITRRDHLQRLDMHAILLSRLSWEQQQRLATVAPTHVQVPSGSHIALDYARFPPALSVRLQEVFGMRETPKVANGKIAVLLELLSPAHRPVQITQDLASFWARGYQDVKKDLKGRYPKHYWPDDPLQAQATARAKRKGT